MKTLPHAGAKLKHTAQIASPLPPLRDLVRSVSLSALVEKYAGAGKSGGRLFRCPNPAHDDNSPSFSVFASRSGGELCGCFVCGHVGDALDFLKWLHSCDTITAIKELRDFSGVAAPRPALKPKSRPRTLTATHPVGIVNDPQTLSNYLDARGWPEEVAETFGLQVMHDYEGVARIRHPYRAWIGGELVEAGWQGRRLDAVNERKWLNAPGVSLPLYNLPALDRDNLTHAVICEGAADTITASIALDHLPSWACVGVAGVQAWRDEWAQFFTGLAVVIAADNDEAGEKLNARIAESLRGVAAEIVAVCPAGNDLTDMSRTHGIASVRNLLANWCDDAEKRPLGCDMSSPKVAEVVEVQAITRCKVCAHEVEPGARYCASCARTEAITGKPWRVCDTCNTFALVELNRRCYVSHNCSGYFTEAVAV